MIPQQLVSPARLRVAFRGAGALVALLLASTLPAGPVDRSSRAFGERKFSCPPMQGFLPGGQVDVRRERGWYQASCFFKSRQKWRMVRSLAGTERHGTLLVRARWKEDGQERCEEKVRTGTGAGGREIFRPEHSAVEFEVQTIDFPSYAGSEAEAARAAALRVYRARVIPLLEPHAPCPSSSRGRPAPPPPRPPRARRGGGWSSRRPPPTRRPPAPAPAPPAPPRPIPSSRSRSSAVDQYVREMERHLIMAVAGGNLMRAKELLQKGAPADARAQEKLRPVISLAAQAGNLLLVQLLLNAGANPALPDMDGRTPLVHAILSGDPRIVETLLRAGAGNVDQPDRGGYTPLHAAILGGDTVIVRLLLTLGEADVNRVKVPGVAGQFHNGWTPLRFARSVSDPGMEALLRSHGAR